MNTALDLRSAQTAPKGPAAPKETAAHKENQGDATPYTVVYGSFEE